MKKLILSTALLCALNSQAQTKNYIKKDTIEVLMYDSLGNEYHSNPPRIVIKRTEMGDPEYWKRIHRRNRIWDRISLGLFVVGTTVLFVVR